MSRSLLVSCFFILGMSWFARVDGNAQATSPKLPADLKIEEGIVFKEAAGQKLDLMFFRPLEAKYEKAPLVVYIHGGGWGKGDKYKVLRRDIIGVIRALNKGGIACASIEYRLVDGKPTTANEAVADCKDAVRFFAKNAERFGIDPDRIGTFGSSAGGHLTLVTALGSDADYPCAPALNGGDYRIRCVASYYPQVSFLDRSLMTVGNFQRPQRLIPLLGGAVEEKQELARKLSPIDLLTPESPAIFLAHGDKDVVIGVENAIAMREAAEEKGVPVTCLISQGAGHGFSGEGIDPDVEEITRQTVAFFLEYLGGD